MPTDSPEIPDLAERIPSNTAWIDTLKKEEPRDVANQLIDLGVDGIRDVLRMLPDSQSANVLMEFNPSLQAELFEQMQLHRVSGIVDEMPLDDAADILGKIPAGRLNAVLRELPSESANKITEILGYPDDSAGGIMNPEFLAVQEDFTIQEAINFLREQEQTGHEGLFYIYVVDKEGRLRGVLRVRDLVLSSSNRKIGDVMISQVRSASVHADQEDIATLFRDHRFSVIPVVDDFQRLCGVITSEDAIDVLEEEATEDMQRMIGLSGEEMLDTPWKISLKNRLPWLYVNLATAVLAGWVVSIFEPTIAKYAVLAVFLPIIAGQGGNAGTQTLTIMVRSMALGGIEGRQKRRILAKELLVGLCTGLATGLAVGIVGWLWRGDLTLGIIAYLALLLNMLAAAASGVLIPIGLKTLKIDPALASSIMLTTVTDVVGFFIFLGLASVGFHYFPPK
ncbi:MAG: magnesium transporter [Chthoniobacterales bacterium]